MSCTIRVRVHRTIPYPIAIRASSVDETAAVPRL
eukprot:COSAG02_NODE_51_length_44689_cov_29.477361_1_plen_33_part_10